MEPKYKVGQYVKIQKVISNDSNIYQNKIGKIIKVDANYRGGEITKYIHLYKIQIQLPDNINADIWEEEIIII